MGSAYFFMADGRVQQDQMPPDCVETWYRADWPRAPASIERAPSTLTVRTFEPFGDRDLWFEIAPSWCDVGETLRRHARLMVAALEDAR